MLPNTIATTFTAVPRSRDLVHAAVVDGLLERPRLPHGLDRAPQLLTRIGGEGATRGVFHERLVLDRRGSQRLLELGVVVAACVVRRLARQQMLELLEGDTPARRRRTSG
jgi:hypothetical protein